MPDGARAEMDPALKLMLWFSPQNPVGGFAYSHGLEAAAAAGMLADAAALKGWLGDILHHGAARHDGILLAESWRAAGANPHALKGLVELAAAYGPNAARRLETMQQGAAFLAVTRVAWPHPCLQALVGPLGDAPPFPVAVGAAARAHEVPLEATIKAYVMAFLANLVSAGIRLSLVGQTGAQQMLAQIAADVSALAPRLARSTLDDLGSATFRGDIAAMAHETLAGRLFRS